jgi:DNA primase
MDTSTTDEIKARLNIVDVIGGYVRLEKSGIHWKACCPFHQERTPSFMVNEEKNMWHCFGCGKGGDVFAFIMEIEGLEFREALGMLAERAGVELPQYRGDRHDKEAKDRTLEVLELATKFYEAQLQGKPGASSIMPYLSGRGLSEESIRTFRLGYAPDGWRHLHDFLIGRGFRPEEMEQAGLVIRKEGSSGYYDRFRDRIIFPIFDIIGRVIGYSARVAPGGDESQAKYINTPETPVYHKSRALYGLYLAKQAMKQEGATIIVEGNVDVIAMHQAGLKNTVAVSGTALTVEQLSIMKRYGNEVKLFFDMDGAGQKAARRSAELALEQEMTVSIVALTSGKDAADIGKDDPEQLRASVAHTVSAPEYFLNRLLLKYDRTTSDGKRHITEEYAEFLRAVKNPIERAHWVKRLAQDIDMDEKVVVSAVNAAFLHQERRERIGHSEMSARSAESAPHSFSRRSELLREELVGIMYADTVVRANILRLLSGDVLSFIEKHPLFFFIVQAGADDPLSIIDDQNLKSEAARVSFRILESPDVVGLGGDERTEKLSGLAARYLDELSGEVMKREKLVNLEHEIRKAREQNDKDREHALLAEFVSVSAQALPLEEKA